MPRQLDRSKPFGIVSGTGDYDALDRAPAYEQSGKLYDAAGILITPGEPLKRKSAGPRKVELAPNGQRAPGDAGAIRSPGELLAREFELPLSVLRQRARVILNELGEECPDGYDREDILDALETALKQGGSMHR
jgi:hypothetical protein